MGIAFSRGRGTPPESGPGGVGPREMLDGWPGGASDRHLSTAFAVCQQLVRMIDQRLEVAAAGRGAGGCAAGWAAAPGRRQ